MKMIDPKDFVLSPEEIAAMKESPAKSPPSHKPARGIEFFKFPKAVLIAIFRANYMPTLALAMAVYEGWYRDFKKRNPVKLTSALLAEFGISRDQKYRALKILEQSGQFLVERSPRRNPLVMMKWKLQKD
jgi:hypothetical protein